MRRPLTSTPRVGQGSFQGSISAEADWTSHAEIDAWLAQRLALINRDCLWRETSERADASACWQLIEPTLVTLCQIEAGRRYRERVAAIRAFCEQARAEAYLQAAEAHARLERRLAEERARLIRSAIETPVPSTPTAPPVAFPSLDPRSPLSLATTPTSAARATRIGQSDPQERRPLPIGTPFTCTHPSQCDLYNFVQDGSYRFVGSVPAGWPVYVATPAAHVPYGDQLILTNRIGPEILVRASTPFGPREGWTSSRHLRAFAAPTVEEPPPDPRTTPRDRLPSRVPVPPSPLSPLSRLMTELFRPRFPTEVIR